MDEKMLLRMEIFSSYTHNTLSSPTALTSEIRLQSTSEYLVYNTTTMCGVSHGGGLTPNVMMEDIDCRYKELVSVLLFISGQVTCMDPYLMEKPEGYMREGVAGVELMSGRSNQVRVTKN